MIYISFIDSLLKHLWDAHCGQGLYLQNLFERPFIDGIQFITKLRKT